VKKSHSKHHCPHCNNTPQYNSDVMYDTYNTHHCPYCDNKSMYNSDFSKIKLKDYGPEPFVVDINAATKQNKNFRTALWTGCYLQLTLMSIPVGGEIGLENHPNLDQFIRIEEGEGLVKMGDSKNCPDLQEKVYDDFAFIIPAGTWHNLINTGNKPLKLYSIYAPPQHPHGTVHVTKADAEAAEKNHRYSRENTERLPIQIPKFTLSELAEFDGTMGKPAYVAINGIVYDVSNSERWRDAMYRGLIAGKDLTHQHRNYRGLSKRLDRLPKIGILIK
jgi:mannose-6-phosphate isomerase-like protein (cupin superfamily)/predicted heme/steroid binding protein